MSRSGEKRIGIVGLGGRGKALARVVQQHVPGAHLVAIADLMPDRVEAAATELGGGLARYGSHKDMLTKEKLDVLIVATLGMQRREPVVDAAAAGVGGVYLEKPMATKLADCDAMIAACKTSGTKLAMGHQRRWWPQYRAVRRAIEDGLIGTPTNGYQYWGSARVGSVGTHMIDALNIVLGDQRAAWVSGWLDPESKPRPKWPDLLDPGAMGFIVYESGFRIALDAMVNTRQSCEIHIWGDEGRILVLEDSYRIELWRQKGDGGKPKCYFPSHFPVPFENPPPPADEEVHGEPEAFRELIEIIGTDREPTSTGVHGRHALEIITAFHISSERNMQPVRLPLEGADIQRDLKFP